MKINTSRTNTVEHRVELDEKQIYRCIADSVALSCGLDLEHDYVDYKVFIEKRERPGLTGYETFAKVIITEDLTKLPEVSP